MKKHALLVGINNYRIINDLQGCVNDVTNVRNILKTYFGYANSDIRVLTDDRATKSNILSRLEKMVESSKKGDSLIFHFSGHGSQIRDRENDELKDHMDELICPCDMNWDSGFITDDMLRAILDKLPAGVRMEVLLDSCHSGTGTRELILEPPSGREGNFFITSRFLQPPVDIECRWQGEESKLKAVRSFRGDEVLVMNHILWAACKDNQTSADAYIGGNYNGAFSYYFCKHIRDSGGNISRDELHARVVNSLSHNHYTQVPQLECNNNLKGGKVFS